MKVSLCHMSESKVFFIRSGWRKGKEMMGKKNFLLVLWTIELNIKLFFN